MKRSGLVVLVLAFVLGGCRACANVAASCRRTEDCTARGACGGDLVSGIGCAVVTMATAFQSSTAVVNVAIACALSTLSFNALPTPAIGRAASPALELALARGDHPPSGHPGG